MLRRPLIGIVTRHAVNPDIFLSHYVAYPGDPEVVHQAGGIPFLIPPLIDQVDAEILLTHLDGLYLAGGEDVSSTQYAGADPSLVKDPSEERDRAELLMLRGALKMQKPILAICRGNQLLNVALGGSLIDDIPTRITRAIKHDTQSGEPYDSSAHTVRLSSGSSLAKIYGRQELRVNSFHHQAVREPGKGLNPVAYAPDEIVEAVEMQGYPTFCLGVQWHPEYQIGCDPDIQKIFQAYIKACL